MALGDRTFADNPTVVPGPSDTVVGTQGGVDVNFPVGDLGGGSVTQVNTGTGLTGGPITSTGTVSLANTAVIPGTYLNATVAVDQQGRITSAASGGGGIAIGDLTVWVNADTGNDSNPGTALAPFKTQVHAWDFVAAINGNGYRAFIQLQDATAAYDGVNLDPNFGNVRLTPFGWQKITIQGNAVSRLNTTVLSTTTPFNTCYSFSSTGCFPVIQIQDMALSSGGGIDSGSIFVGAFCKVLAQNLYVRNIDLGFSCSSEGFFEYEGDLFIYGVDVSPGALISAEGTCTVIFEPSSVTMNSAVNPPNQYAVSARNGAYLQCFLPDMSAYDSLWDFKFWADENANLYINGLNTIPGINPGICTNCASVHSGPRITDPGWLSQICPAPVLDNLTAAQLPSTCLQGATALVTNSTASHAALSLVVGGGTTVAPVIFIGGQWVYMSPVP